MSNESVNEILKSLKAGKASGPDGLTKKDFSLDLKSTAAVLTIIFSTFCGHMCFSRYLEVG